MKHPKLVRGLAVGAASAFFAVGFAGAAQAASNQTTDTVGGAALNPVLPGVAKVITTNAGTALPQRTYNTTFTLNGQVGGGSATAPTLVDPVTGASTITNKQVVNVSILTPATTAVATPCETTTTGGKTVFKEPLTPAGCDMSSTMAGVQVGAESSVFAQSNMASATHGDGVTTNNNFSAAAFGWAHPGQYQYTVSEATTYSPAAQKPAGCDDVTENIVLDNETYIMTINVAVDDQGNLYIKDAAESYGTPGTSGTPGLPGHPGTPGTPGTEEDKVTGTPQTPGVPGTPGEPGYPGTPGDGGTDGIPLSDMAFSNLDNTIGGCPTKPTPTDGGIDVSKHVAGDLGDKTKVFDIKVVPTDPAEQNDSVKKNGYLAVVINDDGSYVAAPVDPSGNALTLAPSALQTVTGAGVFVVPATGIDVGLKDGQHLHFINASYGTAFAGTDNPTANYTPSGTITLGSGTVDLTTGLQKVPFVAGTTALADGTQGQAFTNAVPFVSVDPLAAPAGTPQLGNQEAFTNTYESVAITGIIIHNLPYILVVLLVVGGGTAYMVTKSRSRMVRATRA